MVTSTQPLLAYSQVRTDVHKIVLARAKNISGTS